MPRPFGAMRMTMRSELLYGALFILLALIARSASVSLPVGFLRGAVSMLGVVMLIGGVIVIVVGLWHAARRSENPAPITAPGSPGWFPAADDSTLCEHCPGPGSSFPDATPGAGLRRFRESDERWSTGDLHPSER